MNRLTLSLVFVLLSGVAVFAEDLILTLKDGTVIEGELAGETSLSVTLNVRDASGIKGERKISKDDIASRKTVGADDIAFRIIEKYTPTPDQLPVATYLEQIDGCKRFLAVHKTSEHVPAVTKVLGILQDDLQRARTGALKLDGNWIDAETRQADAYEIDVRIAIGKMKAEIAEGKYRLALRRFEKIEESYLHSERYEEAKALAIEALNAYKPVVSNLLARVDSLNATRKRELLTLPEQERQEEEAAIEERDNKYAQRLQAERNEKTKWPTLEPYHKRPMEETRRAIDSELEKLAAPKTAEFKAAGPVYREAWAAARGGDLEAGKKLVTELRSLKVPERYLEP
jgi:hypothetical protein